VFSTAIDQTDTPFVFINYRYRPLPARLSAMNDNRADLAALKRELERVERELRSLRLRADHIESRIAIVEAPALEPEPIIHRATAVPPPLPPMKLQLPKQQEAPPIIEQPVFDQQSQPEPALAPVPEKIAAQTAEPPPSFELRLGTYWFVRIGIVMLLTTMVFLGNYAYQHYIGRLGPAGKVVLLYTVSAGLLAAGVILPRRREQLKNYGQVLFAGGLAAVYFTTYAAHHFGNLRIIQSAVLDGTLLLAWTAFIVWLADRKKSEVLAVFAIGLAYYAALITNVGNFTLASNLILAVAAVFFLVRNRWTTLSFLSLLASYGSYFYWRYYARSPGLENDPSRLTLIGYWIIFSAAVFLTRHEEFTGRRRVSFLSFNNGAAFALLTFSYLRTESGNFWKLSMASGVTLLALAALARQLVKDDELPRRAYLAQGLLLTTLGFMTLFSGPTLALVLAVESALLLIFSTQWKSRLLHNAAIIVALLGVGYMVFKLDAQDPRAWLKAASLVLILLFQATWSSKKSEEPAQAEALRSGPTYFAGLAILSWIMAVFTLSAIVAQGPVLAATGLILTFSYYFLRVREITLLSQGLVLLGQAQALVNSLQGHPPIWSPLTVIVISIVLALWWKRQQVIENADHIRLPLELISAFAAAAVVYAWLPKEIAGDRWIAIAALLTLGWTAFGGAVRSWAHVAAGQMFLLGTAALTMMHLVDRHEPLWQFPAILVAGFLILAAVAQRIKLREEVLKPLRGIGTLYQWCAAILTLACVMTYVPAEYRFLALTVLFVSSLIPAMFGARYTFAPGLFLAVFGLVYWLAQPRSSGAEVQNLLAILLLAGAQVAIRNKSESLALNQPSQQAWILTVSAALWLFVSRWVIVHSAGAHFYLTASWAVLAFLFFIIGFALRERPYRWAAFVVLAASLGRVVLLDVWKLETIYRIVSFLVLSLVLLALGYIYTRFQDKFAKWL
jgi:uncharacterized membrane protein